MIAFEQQIEAIRRSLSLVRALPANAVWALEVTNDDDDEARSVLNIFAERCDWPPLLAMLHLGEPIDRSDPKETNQFISFRQGTLLVSIIEPEEAL